MKNQGDMPKRLETEAAGEASSKLLKKEQTFPGMHRRTKTEKSHGEQLHSNYGVLNEKSSFAAVEAYKAARTNLMFTRVSEGCQIICFTSTYAGEGKTLNCGNIGSVLAQNGQKVLIIDADMRRPMLHTLFRLSNHTGLSEFLAGLSVDAKSGTASVALKKSECPGLYVLTAGHIPPNPAELLASPQMEVLLKTMAKQFDYILIDTPPLNVVTDAAVIAQSVQGYVLVVRAGSTPLDALESVVLKLERLNAKVLGFILNDLDAKSGSYKYAGNHTYKKYSRYNKYGKYGRYGDRYGNYVREQPGERVPRAVEQNAEITIISADCAAETPKSAAVASAAERSERSVISE